MDEWLLGLYLSIGGNRNLPSLEGTKSFYQGRPGSWRRHLSFGSKLLSPEEIKESLERGWWLLILMKEWLMMCIPWKIRG